MLAVMRKHNDETLHMNIFKLMNYFVAFVINQRNDRGGNYNSCRRMLWLYSRNGLPMTSEEISCIYGENKLQLALQNSVADSAQLKSTRILLHLINAFSQHDPFFLEMCENPLTISVCLQVLERVCVVTHTQTRAQALETHEIIYATARVFSRLVLHSNDYIRHIMMQPD